MMKGKAKGGGVRRSFSDPVLLQRVSQCATSAKRKRVLDPDDIADTLRKTFREYQRKQRGPFTRAVALALQIVMQRASQSNSSQEARLQQLEGSYMASRQALWVPQEGAAEGPAADSRSAEKQGEARAAPSPSRERGESGEDEGSDSGGMGQLDGGMGEGEEGARSDDPSLLAEEQPSTADVAAKDRVEELVAGKEEWTRSASGVYVMVPPAQEGAPRGRDGELAGGAAENPEREAKVPKRTGAFTGLIASPPSAPAALVAPGQQQAATAHGTEGAGQLRPNPLGGAGPPTGSNAQEKLEEGATIRHSEPVPIGEPPSRAPEASEEDAAQLQEGPELPETAKAAKVKASGPGAGKARRARAREAASGQRQRPGGDAAGPAEPGPSSFRVEPRSVSFASLGGIEAALESIRELILQPLAYPELYAWLGVEPPRGVLLHGPPGCGKTMLAHAIAREARVPFFKISAPEIVSGMSGESEAKIRDLFREAQASAPAVVFIDEIDAITPKRETAQREMERRIVAQLLTCIDDLNQGAGARILGTEPDIAVSQDAEREQDGGSTQLPGPGELAADPPKHVVVLGATNRPDSLDPALRRAGRFDREIALGIPDEAARARILQVLSKGLRLEGGFDFPRIAHKTAGFVGADLAALAKEAAAIAVRRILAPAVAAPGLGTSAPQPSYANAASQLGASGPFPPEDTPTVPPVDGAQVSKESVEGGAEGTRQPESLGAFGDKATLGPGIESLQRTGALMMDPPKRRQWSPAELQGLSIRMEDFEAAVGAVQPSAKREGFSTIPDVTWVDVGALGDIREELQLAISRPILHPEEYRALGLSRAMGILLYGPPGCGKTLVAKAIANDAGANFISIKGPELLNKYVGESERAVRQLFQRARASSPCVLFFDEMDAMAPRRASDGNGAAERVVNQLLTEMDGLEGRGSVYIVAATNRPDMLDPALLRPGRLDKLLYVPLPDGPGRAAILRTLIRKVPSVAPDVAPDELADDPRCAGFSGADLAALVQEASVAALRDHLKRVGVGMHVGSSQNGMQCGDQGTSRAGSPDGPEETSCQKTDVDMGPRIQVARKHFDDALGRMRPSVSVQDLLQYERLKHMIRGARGHIVPQE